MAIPARYGTAVVRDSTDSTEKPSCGFRQTRFRKSDRITDAHHHRGVEHRGWYITTEIGGKPIDRDSVGTSTWHALSHP